MTREKLKTQDEITQLRKAGAIHARILREATEYVAVGMDTYELDAYIESRMHTLGVKPLFKGFKNYPAASCISLNEEIVHGLPSKECVMQAGDLVSIDIGVWYNEVCTDAAVTIILGPSPSAAATRLVMITQEALYRGIDQAVIGNRIGDIGAAIEAHASSADMTVIRDLVGHGVGYDVHEEPFVPNYGVRGRGGLLREGLVIAIEPQFSLGTHRIVTLDDDWTIATQDQSLSAHFEHSVAVTRQGPVILTIE